MRGLAEAGVAYGKMYDLYRALWREDDVRVYQNPEFYYAERLFEQHSNVAGWDHISDQSYEVTLWNGGKLIIALTQAYEVTADEVRSTYASLKPFDVLFKTNPYGRVSSQGHNAAKLLNVQIVDASSLHAVLDP